MTREQRLAHAFVDLADTMVSQFDMIDFLHSLTEHSVALLQADAAGVVLADQRGQLRVVAWSIDAARLLELFELQNSEGPCFDCFHSGQAVVNVDPREVEDRWPNFRSAAAKEGFQSVHALPMRLRDNVIGAMNLFSKTTAKLSDEDVNMGQALADVATIGLLQERAVREKELLAEQLQTALNSRVLIEQAKGVLSERAQIPVGEAFNVMRAYARRHGRTLTGVASEVIDGSLKAAQLQPSG
jgi:GAF domain-containing protein